jgi:ribosome-associated toxin RatA of RatAB toxin-antitoxin module
VRRRLLPILALLAGPAAAEDGAWHRVLERDGVVVERRNDPGPRFHEVRATAHSPLSPATIMATLWKHEDWVEFVPYLKRLDVLRDDGDTKLLYEQFRVPFATDRDATMRVARAVSPARGLYEVTSTAVPDEGPPASSEYVRVRESTSRWRLAPAEDGGTVVTYTIRANPGGLVPAWVVNQAQKEATAKFVHAMLERARQNEK